MSSRPIHFEFCSSDPDASVKFFEVVFGWKIARWGEEKYWLTNTG